MIFFVAAIVSCIAEINQNPGFAPGAIFCDPFGVIHSCHLDWGAKSGLMDNRLYPLGSFHSSRQPVLPERTGFYPKPARGHQKTEKGVTNRKGPFRGIIIQQYLQPMGDERAFVHNIARFGAERRFPMGEWANNPQPRLRNNHRDGDKMDQPKPGVTDPRPVKKLTRQDEQKTQNDKHHKKQVGKEKGIGGELIDRGWFHNLAINPTGLSPDFARHGWVHWQGSKGEAVF